MTDWRDIQLREMDRRDSYDEADRLIVNWLDHNPEFERHIFTQVAGVSFFNLDGSCRQTILTICKPLDRLSLRHEVENPVSNYAVAVWHESGYQIGYLNARLGRETLRRMAKGERWTGFIVRIVGVNREVQGATIVIVKLRRAPSGACPPAASSELH